MSLPQTCGTVGSSVRIAIDNKRKPSPDLYDEGLLSLALSGYFLSIADANIFRSPGSNRMGTCVAVHQKPKVTIKRRIV